MEINRYLNWIMCREEKMLELSALNGMSPSYPFTQGSGINMEKEAEGLEEPEMVSESKRNSIFQTQRDWKAYELTEPEVGHMRLRRFKPEKIPTLRRVSEHKVPLLIKKLFPIDLFWKLDNQLLSGAPLSISATFHGRSHGQK